MNTPQIIRSSCLFFVSVFSSTFLQAGSSSTNGVTGNIPVVNELSITGAVSITVPTPAAGSKTGGTGTVASSSTIFRLTTNETNKKVTVSLTPTLPTGVTLGVALDNNSSGLSTTQLPSITTTAADFLTGISNLSTDLHDPSGINLFYTLYLTEAASPGTVTPTVTYTITN